MATIYDLIEVTGIRENTTYSVANGNLLGVVENVTSPELDDGEFDERDDIFIGGVRYRIDLIQEPESSGRFTDGNGVDYPFDPKSESNLDVVFLTVSNGADVRYFIVPNDKYGDINVRSIRTGQIEDVAGNDAAIISTLNNNVNVVCFLRGTLIETENGWWAPVQDLRPGDRVMTADHGLRQIMWIGAKSIAARILARTARLRPIHVSAGALGAQIPHSGLYLSPQHRVLVRSKTAARMFGTQEVLVAIKNLTPLAGIDATDDGRSVEYYHLLLENHEIVFANGAPCESLLLGKEALKSLDHDTRQEIICLFPQLVERRVQQEPCRPLAEGRKGRKLVDRLKKNGRCVVAPDVRCGPAIPPHHANAARGAERLH